MKKIGIITFHNSYNCGSMLETYAIHKLTEKLEFDSFVINFSSRGQQLLYSVFEKNKTLKSVVKNILIFPFYRQIKHNNDMYEKFKNDNFKLTEFTSNMKELDDDGFDFVIAGSDQIWNITIKDFDDAYFLPWVKTAKKIAYAPSFGSKNIMKYSNNPKKYISFLKAFDRLSIRENNGKKWIKEMTGIDVPVVLDPTLLLEKQDYEKVIDSSCTPKVPYIFFYSPGFDYDICRYVKQIAKQYHLKVITWSTKVYHIKLINFFGFDLPKYESPAVYLDLIKNAELVITTSFHGTIFSTIYQKRFITVKNGGMYGDDDRVITLLSQLGIMEQLIPPVFDDTFDYLKEVDYTEYHKNLKKLKKESLDYLKESLRK